MNTNEYFHLLTILDSAGKEDTNTTGYRISQDMLDEAERQCVIWHPEDALVVLGRQYKSTIKKLYPLLMHIRRYVSDNVVYISQTDKNLLPFYNNDQPRINKAIRKQLIEKAKVLWDLNSTYKPHSTAKYYYVCLENLNTMFKVYQSVIASEGDTIDTDEEVSYQLVPAYYLLPTFNANLDIHEAYLFEEVKSAVIKRYPCIPYYSHLVEELNSHTVNADEKIKFDVKGTFSSTGKISKLGIRAVSRICYLKSLEKQDKKCRLLGNESVVDPNIRYREHYLNERFGEWEEYDIKGSVPRVSRAMSNHGDMGDLNEDIYRTMFEPFVLDYQSYFDANVTEWNESVRGFFKLLFMRLFFGGTPKQIVNNILAKEKKDKDRAIKKGASDDNLSPFAALMEQGVDLVALIDKYQKRVFEYCCRTADKRKDTSVFLHESCIYLEVRKELFNRRIDVVQVYDGFYFKKGTIPCDMEEIIQRAASEYCNGNKKFALFNTSRSIGEALHETHVDITSLPGGATGLSLADVIETNIEFIKPKRKK